MLEGRDQSNVTFLHEVYRLVSEAQRQVADLARGCGVDDSIAREFIRELYGLKENAREYRARILAKQSQPTKTSFRMKG